MYVCALVFQDAEGLGGSAPKPGSGCETSVPSFHVLFIGLAVLDLNPLDFRDDTDVLMAGGPVPSTLGEWVLAKVRSPLHFLCPLRPVALPDAQFLSPALLWCHCPPRSTSHCLLRRGQAGQEGGQPWQTPGR